jgi:glutamine---fructose-6-phosphate transaminase (isomerizing)
MCGIVAAVADRDVVNVLLDGIKRLEYRGYDSAGLAIVTSDQLVQRVRRVGKVSCLESALRGNNLRGTIGIAHTRWATHGAATENNAHPHMSGEKLALIHNGIIENHDELRTWLQKQGYQINTDTDSEIIVHLIDFYLQTEHNFRQAVRASIHRLQGAYSLAVMHADEKCIIGVRQSSPLVVGLGVGENFIASDQFALRAVSQQFLFLEDGDIAVISNKTVNIFDYQDNIVERKMHQMRYGQDAIERGDYRHFMQKEIFEQPEAVLATLEGRISLDHVLTGIFGNRSEEIFSQLSHIHIIACGTSYYAGLAARIWLEEITHLSCQVEVASEFRYRKVVVPEKCLFVCISQSGETADTLSALNKAKSLNYLATLAICNVAQSAMVRAADLVFLTRAGREIGVASTKAFTTQLISLLLLALLLQKEQKNQLTQEIVTALLHLPTLIAETLALDDDIARLAASFADKQHALFLGRGALYPIALEGALKLKEISYIHAEAYPAGELKHGPLALVDKNMPVIAVAPKNKLIEKLKANLHEVKARGGQLIVFTEKGTQFDRDDSIPNVIMVPKVHAILAPILYTIPLQLLAYHVAVLKGTDVDQPRNLAKSVTVE